MSDADLIALTNELKALEQRLLDPAVRGTPEAVAELLADRQRAAALGAAAREHVIQHYRLESCVAQHLALMQLVASGALKAS